MPITVIPSGMYQFQARGPGKTSGTERQQVALGDALDKNDRLQTQVQPAALFSSSKFFKAYGLKAPSTSIGAAEENQVVHGQQSGDAKTAQESREEPQTGRRPSRIALGGRIDVKI